MVGTQVGVARQFPDGPAGLVLHALGHGGVEADTGDGLHGLGSTLLGRQDGRRRALEGLALRRWRGLARDAGALVQEVAEALLVGRLPFSLVALDLPLLHDPRSFGLQGDVLGLQGGVVVQHPLRLFGVADDALLGVLAVDDQRGTGALQDRHVVAVTVGLLQHLQRGDLGPLQFLGLDGAAAGLLDRPGLDLLQHTVGQVVFPAGVPVVQHHQFALVVLEVVILRNPDFLVVDPFLVLIADGLLTPGGVLRVREVPLELLLGHHLGQKPPLRVDTEGLPIGVQVHVHGVGDRLDHDHLVEGLVVLVLGQDSCKAPAVVDG